MGGDDGVFSSSGSAWERGKKKVSRWRLRWCTVQRRVTPHECCPGRGKQVWHWSCTELLLLGSEIRIGETKAARQEWPEGSIGLLCQNWNCLKNWQKLDREKGE
jgi:hypothetical protein